MTEAQRLAEIRKNLDAIAPGRFRRAADADGELLIADGPMRGELLPLARFDAIATDAEKDFLADAPAAVAFMLDLVDRAIRKLRPAQKSQPKDYAAQASMLCEDPGFKAFLEAEHGLGRPLTDERCAQKLRSLCAVTSRAEFNQPGRAADAWRDLAKAFESWKRRERS